MDILGTHFIPVINGEIFVFDEASIEPQVEKEERKPGNMNTPQVHNYGKRMKVTFKGPLEGQAVPAAGTSLDSFELQAPVGFDTTTFPQDHQDVIAGAYGNWCVGEPKYIYKQGVAEYDGFDIMSDGVSSIPAVMPPL